MVFFIIGIIIFVSGIVMAIFFCRNCEDTEDTIGNCMPPILLGAFLAAIMLLIGGFAFPSECTVLKKEIQLVSLSNSVGTNGSGFIFLNVSSDNVYSYRYEIETPPSFKGAEATSYHVDTINGKYVTEIEVADCDKPLLQIYTSYNTFWYASFLNNTQKYLFIVPKGTIRRELVLN